MLRRFRHLLYPVLGILALIALNAAFDLARGSLAGPGSFLHISLHTGAPAGPLIDILHNSSRTIILAIGMTLVIAVRGVDLSVGSVMAVAGAVAATSVADHGPLPAIIAALACAAFAGLWNGVLVSILGIQPIIATLILMVAGRGIAQMVTAGQVATFQDPSLSFLAAGKVAYLPFSCVLALVIFLAAHFVVRKSAVGLLIEAVGENPVAARLTGIRARTLIVAVYIFAASCAGVAGLIDASNIKAADPVNSGLNAELAAIFAVVVGGTSLRGGRFSLGGAVIGGLLIQTLITTMYARDIRAEVAPLPQALVIVVVSIAAGGRMGLRSMRALVRSTIATSSPRWLNRSDDAPASTTQVTTSTQSSLAAPVILSLALLIGALRYEHFFSFSTLPTLLNDYTFLAVAALGATLVILSGGIDLSAGSVIACTSILIATLISRGAHPLAAFAIALVAGACFGALQGWLIQTFRLPPFMVTLAGMFAARAAGFVIHPQSLPITHGFYTATRTAGLPLGLDAHLSLASLVGLATLVITWLVASRTLFGRAIYALGGNERSALSMGLPITRTRILTYAIAGFLYALAGCLFTMYKESGDPASAVGLELDIISATVIGGTVLSGGVGSVWGTLTGVLILATIRRIIDFEGTLSAAWTSVATGLILLLYVATQRLVWHATARER